eukprot:g274.t1
MNVCLPKCHKWPPSSAKKVIALLYNLVQASGWIYAAASLWKVGGSKGPHDFSERVGALAWPTVGPIVVFLQTFAFVEILLSLVGVIPSNIVSVALQLVVRNIVLLLTVNRHHGVQLHLSTFLFLLAWIITECIRFPWLIFKVVGEPPAALSNARYILPLVLYPLGGVGEGWAMYRAMGIASGDILFMNVSLAQIIKYVYFPLYVPGFCFLYVKAAKSCMKMTSGGEKEKRS